MAQVIVQVVLDPDGRRRIVPLSKLVHIQEILSSKEVIDGLVVFCLVVLGIETGSQYRVGVGTPFQAGCQVEVILVHMPLLKGVLRTTSLGIPVDIVEPVPVHVGRGSLMCLPGFTCPGSLLGIQAVVVLVGHVVIAGQIAVVVRPGIRSVIPVKCRVTVLSGPEEQGSGSLQLL